MEIEIILSNTLLKAKAKTEEISNMLLNNKVSVAELIKVAQVSNDSEKATCIEAIEYATKLKSEISSSACFAFVTKTLLEKAPRIKWESAKVIGNIAHLYPEILNDAVKNLLTNSEHAGTVVRWSAAFALGEILKLRTNRNKNLIPAIESIVKREEQNSIRKIYLAALKKVAN